MVTFYGFTQPFMFAIKIISSPFMTESSSKLEEGVGVTLSWRSFDFLSEEYLTFKLVFHLLSGNIYHQGAKEGETTSARVKS